MHTTAIAIAAIKKKPLATNSMSMNILEFYTIIIEPNYKLVHSDINKKKKKRKQQCERDRGKPVWKYVLTTTASCQPNN